jgi:hypothetical protein
MIERCEGPPVAEAGGLNCSLPEGGNDFSSKDSLAKNQAPSCPIVLATQCRLVADLLAESIEFAVGYGVAILSAVREGDDTAILSAFRGFDAATRCARRCAIELRSLLHDAGGAQ